MTTTIQYRSDRVVVPFDGEITWDSATEFVQKVDGYLDYCQRIEVVVSSPGGSVAALEHILRALARWRARGIHVHTRVIASASSCAAVLVSLGDERTAEPGARLLYHDSRVVDAREVTADRSAEIHGELTRIDQRFVGYLVARALRGRARVQYHAEPSDREVLEHLAAAISASAGPRRRRQRVKQLASALGRALDVAVRDGDDKTLALTYQNLLRVDRSVSAPLARTLHLIDRIDDAGDTLEPRSDAPDGLTIPEWQALYPPSGEVPRSLLTRHFVALGETGSGKTFSVILPLLMALVREPRERHGFTLVIDPKQEIAPALERVAPRRLHHVSGETLALNLMVGERWSIDAELAAGRWASAAEHILRRAASFLPASALQVLGPHKVSDGNAEFFNQEGTALLRDVLAFILMLTAAPAKPDWIDPTDKEALQWESMFVGRACRHRDGRRGPNALALCAWAIADSGLVPPFVSEEGWLFERLARYAMPVWGATLGEGHDVLQRVFRYWFPLTASSEKQASGTLATARTACAEFAAPQVARNLYFGFEPGWSDAQSCSMDFASLVSRKGDGRFTLYQPRRDNLDRLVAMALKALFFEAVLADSDRVSGGDGMPLVGYVADEFHRFVTSDAVHGEQSFLDTCRSFGAFCALGTQSTRSITYSLSLGGAAEETNKAALDIMLTNTATKYFFRSTDGDTMRRAAALCPKRPGIIPPTDARPLASLAPGECYVALADGRFELRQLAPVAIDEPRERARTTASTSKRSAPSVQPMEPLSKALAIARSIEDEYWHAQALQITAQAQAAAGDIDGALAVTRSIGDSVIGNPRAEALRAIAEAHAAAGDIEDALAISRSIEDVDDEHWRTQALRAFAQAQAVAGSIEGALTITRSIEDAGLRAETLRAIAEGQACAGDIEGALDSARSIEVAARHDDTLNTIARAQAVAGNVEGAVAIAQGIDDVSSRDDALVRIVVVLANAGELDGAPAIAGSIKNAFWRNHALGVIAEGKARHGDIEGALDSVRSIEVVAEYADSPDETLCNISEAQARAGDFEGAKTFAERIEDADLREAALFTIADLQASAGDIEGVRTLHAIVEALKGAKDFNFQSAEEAEDAEQRLMDAEDAYVGASPLRIIAEGQVHAGDIGGALAIVRTIEYPYVRARMFCAIAEARANAGKTDEALAIARSIEEFPYMRANALFATAEAQARAGDIEGALDSARSIEVAARYADTLRAIAEARANAGKTDEALAIARSIEEFPYMRANALFATAEAQARAGDIEGALDSARSIEVAARYADTLRAIAEAQAASGDVEGAVAMARSIEAAYVRAEALRAIAEAQAASGDVEGAVAIARSIEHARIRDEALCTIAEAQAASGDVEGAVAMARSIEAAYVRAEALRAIAEAQAASGDVEGAAAIARSIEHARLRDEALCSIVDALVSAFSTCGTTAQT